MIEKINSIQPYYINQVKNVPQIKVFNQILGELVTTSKKTHLNKSIITTLLQNKMGKILGKEIFTLEEGNPISTGALITVEPEYQKKNFRLGEILRLSSIIMILENKIKEFQIHSKSSAIFFHAKYKFEPTIKQFSERDLVLESIVKNSRVNGKRFANIKKEAKALLKESRNKKEAEKQRDICVKTNALLKRYFAKILEEKDGYKKHPFLTGISMTLTDDIILKNKDFFNTLFKKHNINYQI